MSETTNNVVRLYFQPQSFPCGPNSSCCGPAGQSEEELREYRRALEAGLPGVELELVDASQRLNLGRDLPVIRLLNTFGAAACPIFTVNGEVISMGPPALEELIPLIQEKLGTPPARA